MDVTELRSLTTHAVEQVNEAYRRLHGGVDDIGEPTSIGFDPVMIRAEHGAQATKTGHDLIRN